MRDLALKKIYGLDEQELGALLESLSGPAWEPPREREAAVRYEEEDLVAA